MLELIEYVTIDENDVSYVVGDVAAGVVDDAPLDEDVCEAVVCEILLVDARCTARKNIVSYIVSILWLCVCFF